MDDDFYYDGFYYDGFSYWGVPDAPPKPVLEEAERDALKVRCFRVQLVRIKWSSTRKWEIDDDYYVECRGERFYIEVLEIGPGVIGVAQIPDEFDWPPAH